MHNRVSPNKGGFLIGLLFASAVIAEPVRIGLALSGGAALGLAHIGVLKVLEREGIDFVGIAGNSMGSMVGGVYAAGYSAAQIESIALAADWNRLFSSRPGFGAQYLQERQQALRYVLQLRHKNFVPYLPSGLVSLQNVELLLNHILAEIEFNTGYDFDRLPVPYRAVAVDINKGELVVLHRGRLEQAIRASIAIPGVFAPEMIDGKELVDGGVMEYLPVEPVLDFKPDFIIAVLTMHRAESPGKSLIDIASRSLDLMGIAGVERAKSRADVVIEPDVSRFLHSDFTRVRELIAAGESAAIKALPVIREKLKGRVPIRLSNQVEKRALPVVREIR
ncbi:MAG: patatin-like phospholipase family protein, partial [bacterium]